MTDSERAVLAAAAKSLVAWSDARAGYIALCAPSSPCLDRDAVKTLAAQGYLARCDDGAFRIAPSGRRRLALSDLRARNAARFETLRRSLAGI